MFKPGQSGNPSGRAKLDPETRALIKKNGKKATERLEALLNNDQNFHRQEVNDDGEMETIKGELDAKSQLTLLSMAIERAYGKNAQPIDVEVAHSGQINHTAAMDRLAQITDKLPERLAGQSVVDMIDVTPEPLPAAFDDDELLR